MTCRRALRALSLVIPLFLGDAFSVEASWSALYGSGAGGDVATVVVRSRNGGYAVGGVSSGFGVTGLWLLRLNGVGIGSFQKLYTWGADSLRVNDMIETADGGFVVVGDSGTGCTAAWALKVDQAGDVVWSKTYSTVDPSINGCGDEAGGVVENQDGQLMVAGRVSGYFGLARLQPDGSPLAVQAYRGGAPQGNSRAVSLVQTPQGYFVAGGDWVNPATGRKAYRILLTDYPGNPAWQETFGGAQDNTLLSIGAHDGDVAVTGSSVEVGGIWTIRLDISGNVVWQKTYAHSDGETGSGIGSTDDGGFALVGFAGSSSPRAAMLKLTGGGTIQWSRQFAEGSASRFHRAVVTYDGGQVLAVGEDEASYGARFLALQVDRGGIFVGCLNEEVSSEWSETVTTVAPVSLDTLFVDEWSHMTATPLAVTATDTDAPERTVCYAGVAPLTVYPYVVRADVHPTAESNGNGLAEPGETVIVEPSWRNLSGSWYGLAGNAPPIQDTNGLELVGGDLTASYGSMPAGATSDCYDSTGDCYAFRVASSRPSPHWDVSFDETLGSLDPHVLNAWRWRLHVGHSFLDVPESDPAYWYIEALLHNSATAGCGTGDSFCPDRLLTRAQMAPLLLKGRFGGDYSPPPCSATVFSDVPCPGAPFVDWVNQLATEGVTAGCGGGAYCPDGAVTRAAMAVFLLKGEHGGWYAPPQCAATVFADVPCPSGPFVDWVNQLASEGITTGCGGGDYCPNRAVDRRQTAVLVAKTFRLPLN